MESLEAELGKVSSLERDLSAEVIVSPEEGHFEHRVYRKLTKEERDARYDLSDAFEDVWIIDKPEERAPDIQRRQSARAKLQQVYDSSEWYSARYNAGIILRERVNEVFPKWMSELRKNLLETKLEDYTRYDDTEKLMLDTNGGGTSADGEVTKPVSDLHSVSNEEKRATAKKDLSFMYHSLQDKNHRIEAGKSLGYSNLRIWAHELAYAWLEWLHYP